MQRLNTCNALPVYMIHVAFMPIDVCLTLIEKWQKCMPLLINL